MYALIEPTLRNVAARHHMKVSPWRWDDPSITLSWESHGYSRNARVRIVEELGHYKLALSGAAWRDVTEGAERKRQFTELRDLGLVSVPESREASSELSDELEKTWKSVEQIDKTISEVVLNKAAT